jgi:cystathionine beta-lyase/cystathionine gamma-synthase
LCDSFISLLQRTAPFNLSFYFSIFAFQFIIMKPATKYIHAGMNPDPSTGAIIPPVYQTSTYVQEAPATHKGYEYARSQNPTRTALKKPMPQLKTETMPWLLAVE